MMQAQMSNRMTTKPQPRNWHIAGVLALVAAATVAANVLMALGWSRLLGGDVWLAQADMWRRLAWTLGFGALMATNNALAASLVWVWARQVQQQAELRKLVRWASQERKAHLTNSLPFIVLPALVLLAPALLMLV
ncbi:MAG: hypothetical protein DLM69_05945 [Candidatus Chloroheliales bacterium]|nr:MAG: hypothetical protein DLM69_05945 [Chloroflexota bacterium]